MSTNLNDEPTDPRLKAILDELRPIPPRDPDSSARGKANFLAQADVILEAGNSIAKPAQRPTTWRDRLSALRLSFGQRTAITAVAAIIAVLVLLFSGAGMTALAARSALPGDALYSVKTRLEDTQVTLTSDAARQVELQLALAGRRLDEIEKLISQGRFADITLATREFDRHIQTALTSLQAVAAVDPARAAVLAAQITADLTRYAQALSGMTATAPEMIRTELMKAMQTSENIGLVQVKPDGEIEFVGLIEQLNPGLLVVNGQTVRLTAQTEIKNRLNYRFEDSLQIGMLVKVHARRGSDGVLTAREVELVEMAPGNENANINSNDDANLNGADDRSHDNANEDHDRSNSNTNDDRAGNTNSNHNDNDDRDNENNTNNRDDDANSNDNRNDNDNQDHDNQNDDDYPNDNDNHNDNDDQNENDNDNDHNENQNDNG